MMRAVLLIAAALCMSQGAAAESFPTRSITLVVPYAAGGTNDIIARAVANKMASSLGKPVVVENRSGAGGNVGSSSVAKAAPDGYTLLTAPIGILAINKWLYTKLGYDPEKDFAPITLAGSVPNVLLGNSSVPARDVKELIAYARANPNKITFASMGTGTTGHLNGEMLKILTSVDIQHVPYRGSSPALQDLLGGHVNIMFDNLPTALPLVKSGQLKAFAVTSTTRSESLPDVPTLNEAGVRGFDATAWFGFVAPAGTPTEILDLLNSEIVKALRDPEVAEKLKAQGVTIAANSRAEFRDVIDRESKRWKDVVEQSGAKVE
jgi:tripartite-type tricarboxylate transporter receptor subunit TctC